MKHTDNGLLFCYLLKHTHRQTRHFFKYVIPDNTGRVLFMLDITKLSEKADFLGLLDR